MRVLLSLICFALLSLSCADNIYEGDTILQDPDTGGIVIYDKGEFTDGWQYIETTLSNMGGTDEFLYSDALIMIDEFNQTQFPDWTLPTVEESRYLIDSNYSGIVSVPDGTYWTSEETSGMITVYIVNQLQTDPEYANYPDTFKAKIRLIRKF